jgi:hypothetical protein
MARNVDKSFQSKCLIGARHPWSWLDEWYTRVVSWDMDKKLTNKLTNKVMEQEGDIVVFMFERALRPSHRLLNNHCPCPAIGFEDIF